jgi:hypothetical protein
MREIKGFARTVGAIVSEVQTSLLKEVSSVEYLLGVVCGVWCVVCGVWWPKQGNFSDEGKTCGTRNQQAICTLASNNISCTRYDQQQQFILFLVVHQSQARGDPGGACTPCGLRPDDIAAKSEEVLACVAGASPPKSGSSSIRMRWRLL